MLDISVSYSKTNASYSKTDFSYSKTDASYSKTDVSYSKTDANSMYFYRLYMTTSMSNPHYLPAVYIQVNIINFTVTFEGLQEQLLSAVVRQVSTLSVIFEGLQERL